MSGADHLPKRRQGGQPRPPEELPRQRRGITPQLHGRYPDFDVLEQADHWDEVTRRAVLRRVGEPPRIRFFSPAEAATLAAFCDCVLAQDYEPRVPVLPYVDEKLFCGRLDGYQYAELPDDRETWQLVARGLDEAAQARGFAGYASADAGVRADICGRFARGALEGGVWERLPPARAFSVVMRAVLAAFYSHPWAWNEIGFGGPAYPRGYARLGIGQREGYEGDEAVHIDPVTDVAERGLE